MGTLLRLDFRARYRYEKKVEKIELVMGWELPFLLKIQVQYAGSKSGGLDVDTKIGIFWSPKNDVI